MRKQYVLTKDEKESYESIARENIELQRKINSGIKWYHKMSWSGASWLVGLLMGVALSLYGS